MRRSQTQAYLRFLAGLIPYLRQPISIAEARATIQRRLERRGDHFLELARRGIYGEPRSPFLPLLRRAGCEYADLEQGVHRDGVEALLARLQTEGVYVSFDEFKCRTPIVRGDLHLTPRPEDFDNRRIDAGYQVSTGGSSGRPVRTLLDLDFLAGRAVYDAVMFEMLGVGGAPLALWYPSLPANTGIGNSLRYAKIGRPPRRWFNLDVERQLQPGPAPRAALAAILALSRVAGRPLPLPTPLAYDEVGRIVDWAIAARARHGRCVVQSYVSRAVRISRAARERGVSLEDVLFIIGSEPLTEAKVREIRASGASLYGLYFATEVGSVAMACGAGTAADDCHLLEDSLALVQPDPAGGPLFYSTLLPHSPKVLLNVQLGDTAHVESRSCGCPFGALGLTRHLEQVRSLDATSCEAMRISRSDLTSLCDSLLPEKYGGSSIDYQWLERETDDALTRLYLRVDPRLGPLNETAIVADVIAALHQAGWGDRLGAELWRAAGTVQVLREPPQPTAQGKHLPLLQERTAAARPAKRPPGSR